MLPGARLSLRPIRAPPWPRSLRGAKGARRGISTNRARAIGRAPMSTCRLRRSSNRQSGPWPASRASRPARARNTASPWSRLGPRSVCSAPRTPAHTSCSRPTSRRSARRFASSSFRPASSVRPIATQLSTRAGWSPSRPTISSASASHCRRRASGLVASGATAGRRWRMRLAEEGGRSITATGAPGPGPPGTGPDGRAPGPAGWWWAPAPGRSWIPPHAGAGSPH